MASLPPFPLWTAFPSSEYYGGSVPLGLAPVRESRVSCTVRRSGRFRCPFHVLEIATGDPASWSVFPNGQDSFGAREAPDVSRRIRAAVFTEWTLGFRQSSFHHADRVSTGLRPGGFVVPCLSAHAVFPSGFRLQVSVVTQGYHAQPLLCSTGIELHCNTAHLDRLAVDAGDARVGVAA